jgi:hypothetical protein
MIFTKEGLDQGHSSPEDQSMRDGQKKNSDMSRAGVRESARELWAGEISVAVKEKLKEVVDRLA